MKVSKFSMIAGTFVLAVAAIFAGKTNKKFTAVSTGSAQGGNIYWKAPYNMFTTDGNIPIYVELVTLNGAEFVRGGRSRLYTVGLGETPLYVK